MQCFSGIWDGLLFLHLINIRLWHYFFYQNATLSALWENFSSHEIKYFTSYCIFLRCSEKKNLLLYSEYPGCFGGSLFFRLDNMFYLASFLLTCMIFRVLGKHLLLCQRNMFYHLLCFREIAFASLYIYYLWVFVLIRYLQCNIFICLRYHWRTIFLYLNNMFFRVAFVSDTWEEPYYFVLRLCFSVFYLSQISEKIHINSP